MATEEFASVWTRPKRKRREQPALSQEQIVAEAMKLLDADGLEALSMRKLGAALGAVATAVYWHVANKDELLELVVDQVYGEVDVPAVSRPDEWRPAAAACAESFRGMVVRHPWMAVTLAEVGLTYLGPNMTRVSDRMLALYEGGGFELIEANQASKTVIAFVLGYATSEAASLTQLHRSGLSMDDWMAKVWPAAEEAAQKHPRMKALYAAHRGMNASEDSEDTFGYGLARVLDGLEARLQKK
jgi:AcrR family transcriptional regulator